jgi:hypothetical protein
MLRRLFDHAHGLYDDLVVVHDGPDTNNVREIVVTAGGRFFEGPREYQQEPHWPFAWEQAAHEWILRLDADEFPSGELKLWLQEFRSGTEPKSSVSGFTCCWPWWNGRRAVSKKWPVGRNFLIHRQRVRFFGMVEQVPVPDGEFEFLDLVLHHQPIRKSHGLYNVLFRKQAYYWRNCISRSLLGKPTDLNCWRWEDPQWPLVWEQIRQHPLRSALNRLGFWTLKGMRDQWKLERRIYPLVALSAPVYHALLCLRYWRLARAERRSSS